MITTGHRMLLHQDSKKREPVHARHLEVKREHVGFQLLDLVPRDIRIDCGTHHFDLWIGAQRVGDQLPNDC